MMDDPNSVDPQGNMNPDSNIQNNAVQTDSKLSEDDSRRLILESYEKAGVDLPLVTLETILDREISEDDARQTGAPRFRKFLNKASAMAHRTKHDGFEEGPDDELDELGADELSLPSAASYTSNVIPDPPPLETPQVETPQYEAPKVEPEPVPAQVPVEPEVVVDVPQTPQRSEIPNTTADGAALVPPTPEAMKNDCAATFDFCCPQKTQASPAKYVMSNLQLPEGFEDEQQSVDVQEPRDVPALMDNAESMMDNEESMMDESSTKVENPGQVSKGDTGAIGFLSFFRGSRRFRFAVLICCLLHVILIGLIIAFVTSRDTESFQAGSASASIPVATTPPAVDNEAEFVTATTLSPDPDLDQQIDEIFTNVTNTTIDVVEEEEPPAVAIGDDSTDVCVDSLKVDVTCFDQATELFVHFVSCTPEAGDWVAIFDSSADDQALVDSEAIGWMYTCGDRFCEEAVQEQTLSFSRAKDRAEHEGTYKAYLMREGEGPIFSSIASSPEFRILTDATSSC